jgi:hypothetical protein
MSSDSSSHKRPPPSDSSLSIPPNKKAKSVSAAKKAPIHLKNIPVILLTCEEGLANNNNAQNSNKFISESRGVTAKTIREFLSWVDDFLNKHKDEPKFAPYIRALDSMKSKVKKPSDSSLSNASDAESTQSEACPSDESSSSLSSLLLQELSQLKNNDFSSSSNNSDFSSNLSFSSLFKHMPDVTSMFRGIIVLGLHTPIIDANEGNQGEKEDNDKEAAEKEETEQDEEKEQEKENGDETKEGETEKEQTKDGDKEASSLSVSTPSTSSKKLNEVSLTLSHPDLLDPTDLIYGMMSEMRSDIKTNPDYLPFSRNCILLHPLTLGVFSEIETVFKLISHSIPIQIIQKIIVKDVEQQQSHNNNCTLCTATKKCDLFPQFRTKFSIEFFRRGRSSHLDRMEIINHIIASLPRLNSKTNKLPPSLSSLIPTNHSGFKVDLKKPEFVILVEICGRLTGVSVLEDYLSLGKYNVRSLFAGKCS